jgi:hypothetical protein
LLHSKQLLAGGQRLGGLARGLDVVLMLYRSNIASDL